MKENVLHENKQWTINADQKVLFDPLLESLVMITEYFGNPCSAESLIAGIPVYKDGVTPKLVPQIAARAGMSAKLNKISLQDIPSLLLPSLLLLNDKQACLLTEIDHQTNKATIQLAETGGEQRLSIEELDELYVGYLFLIKQRYHRYNKGLTHYIQASKAHWLWENIKEAMPAYKDVLIASILINLFALVSPLFIMNIYDKVLPNQSFDSLWVLAIGASIAFIFDFIMRKLRSYIIDVAGKRIDIIVSAKIFAKVMSLPFAKRAQSVGATAKQLTEFDTIRDFLTSASITTLVDLPFAIFFFIIIWLVAGDLAVLPLIGGICIIAYSLFIQPKLKKALDESCKYSAVKHGHLVESLTAIESIKAYCAEGFVQQHWQQMTGHTANWHLKVKNTVNNVANLGNLIVQLTTISVVVLGVYRVSESIISMGGIIAAVMLSSRAITPLTQLANLITRANQTHTSFKQLNEIMLQKDEFESSSHLVSTGKLSGKIEIENLSFNYPDSKKNTLKNISIKINPQEKIGIIGRNGSGKTTLAKLILGLLKPSDGSITYDGIDADQIHPTDLRKNFGYVPQDILLFHGSIRDNILFGSRQISDHQLKRAVMLSGVHLFTNNESEGLHQQVGEGGNALSRGQRQAIILARSILHSPSILLLDEPTASLDAKMENQFIKNMGMLSNSHGLLLVTHKIHLLKLVDRIILIDKGQILADGPRDEVLTKISQNAQKKENVQK